MVTLAAVVRERRDLAATCLTSVSSDGQLTVATLTFEPQRQLFELKRAHAGVSAMPGRDPLQSSAPAAWSSALWRVVDTRVGRFAGNLLDDPALIAPQTVSVQNGESGK